jgi:hypothetical protein
MSGKIWFITGASRGFGRIWARPPLRVFLGTEGMQVARAAFAGRLALWEAWETTSNAAQGLSRKRVFDPALG